ncbi:MAG TPA: hypothetical protein VGB83_03040 [Actinomycetota bacterium]
MRRTIVALTVLITAIGFDAGTAGPAAVVGVLTPGASLFWNGGRVGGTVDRAAGAPETASAECPDGPCFVYAVEVAKRAARLRIAIDVPNRNDHFRIRIVSPSGETTEFMNFNKFNAEGFVADPAPGTWSVAVSPLTAEYSSFRLRAKLEKTEWAPPASLKKWLPNLRVPRIWEPTFVAPVTGIAGVMFDDVNPPLEAAGVHPFSCTADEMQGGAHRCLRFSFQMATSGPGAFDVRFDRSTEVVHGEMVQCIAKPGGTAIARPAGTYTFHEVHGHYHYDDVVLHELFRVKNRAKGKLVRAGTGEKTGYGPADQSFADWTAFNQAASGTSGSGDNCLPGSTGRIGLSRGWGDAYRWQRPGNFVEFGDNPDGWYVIRTTADPLDHLKETNEHDNAGYAYVRIIGDSVRLLEQGMGTSPWDPDKVVNPHD